MILTEELLISMLHNYRQELSDLYTAYSYEDFESEEFEDEDFEKEKESLGKETEEIDRVLNGKETIKLADDSVWLYFNNILKIR